MKSQIFILNVFFQGMFLEEDNVKKDSLFLKGSEVAKNSVLMIYFYKTSTKFINWRFYFQNIISISEASKSSYHRCIGGQQISYGT